MMWLPFSIVTWRSCPVLLSARQASFHICRKLFPICVFCSNNYIEHRLRCFSSLDDLCSARDCSQPSKFNRFLFYVMAEDFPRLSVVASTLFFWETTHPLYNLLFPNISDPSLRLMIFLRNSDGTASQHKTLPFAV